MGGYLVYHPRRQTQTFGKVTVHFDNVEGNQDPYVWNVRFLHTYCHMPQMKLREEDVCVWVSGDKWPSFTQLFCDLVFVVEEKTYWKNANKIARRDAVVDSDESWNDHYQWGNSQHPFKRRRRFTLKANPTMSFQPQMANGSLIDLVPFFETHGYPLSDLRKKIVTSKGSRPLPIDDLISPLYAWIEKSAKQKLYGAQLHLIRLANPNLGSHAPKHGGCCMPKAAPVARG